MPDAPTSDGGGKVAKRFYSVRKAKSKLKGMASDKIKCFNLVTERLRHHLESTNGDVERERKGWRSLIRKRWL